MNILNLTSFNSNKTVKSGWENRRNFQESYGLKMTQEDIQEGKEILKAMEKAERKAAKNGADRTWIGQGVDTSSR